MNCIGCNKPVEQERVTLLNSKICSVCAKSARVDKVKGAMVYDHKTAGYLQIMKTDTYNVFKKTTARVGQKSVLRRYSQNITTAR